MRSAPLAPGQPVSSVTWALILVAAVLSCTPRVAASTSSSLVLTYVVTRHGARNLLPKSALNLTDLAVGVSLLPLGERQSYQAGQAFAQRYMSPTGCVSLRGVAGEPDNTCLSQAQPAVYGVVTDGVAFSSYNTLVVSSVLQRSMMSATSFMAGVFPAQPGLVNNTVQAPLVASAGSAPLASGLHLPTGQQEVPIYTAAGADADDVLIRTYTKCPTYDAALLAWYSSPQFLNISAASAPLRAHVAALLAGWPYTNGLNNNTDLENWYNVFDAFNVYYTTGYGNPMPAVNSTVYAYIVRLANWLESAKMASPLAGHFLGGPLLLDVQTTMSAAVDAIASGSQHIRLKVVSAHYNVQLGLLAALRLDKLLSPPVAATVPWLTAMPATAAVLAFEVHQLPVGSTRRRGLRCVKCATSSQFAVRAVYQNGPNQNYTALPLPCTSATAQVLAGTGACWLDDFVELLAPAVTATGTPAAWCRACNIATPLPCAAAFAASAPPPASVLNTPTYKRTAIGLGIGLGAPLAASMAVIGMLCRHRGGPGGSRGIEFV